MAEFLFENKEGSSKKKSKMPSWMPWAIGGAGLAVVALLLSNKKAEDAVYITDGYPDNSVDTAAQLQNYSDIISGSTESMLNSYYADMQSYLTATTNDLTASINEQLNQVKQEQSAINTRLDIEGGFPVETAKRATFATGIYGSYDAAAKALNLIQQSGLPLAKIQREGNSFRVVGEASTPNAANEVMNQVRSAGLAKVTYVNVV